MSRGRTQLLGRSVGLRSPHPSRRAKKIRQILAGGDMGHEEEMERRSNRWPPLSLVSGLSSVSSVPVFKLVLNFI